MSSAWPATPHHYASASGRYPQAIFDHGKALALYHTKRLASPAQRIMLYAKDRGCTKPGCDAPAYHSQVHHVRGWAATRRTDINDLTLACGRDNRLVEKGWTTRTNAHGDTQWLPPPHLDRRHRLHKLCDGEEGPFSRHALELVSAALLELDP